MKKTSSREQHLTLADRHIALAEERVCEQVRELLKSTARGEDNWYKAEFVLLLVQSLSATRCYRAGLSRSLSSDGESTKAVDANSLATTSDTASSSL
jgi:hypothetical protein